MIIPEYRRWRFILRCRGNGLWKKLLTDWFLFCHRNHSSSSITVNVSSFLHFFSIPAGGPQHLFPSRGNPATSRSSPIAVQQLSTGNCQVASSTLLQLIVGELIAECVLGSTQPPILGGSRNDPYRYLTSESPSRVTGVTTYLLTVPQVRMSVSTRD